jgi:hypothetical protein
MSRTPGRIKFAGPRIGRHQDDVLAELEASGRLDSATAARLRKLAPETGKNKPQS